MTKPQNRLRYLRRKRRDKTITSSENAELKQLLAGRDKGTPSATHHPYVGAFAGDGSGPPPIDVPLGTDPTGAAAPSSPGSPSPGLSSAAAPGSGPAAPPQDDGTADMLATALVEGLKAANAELRKYPGTFTLPDVIYDKLVYKCARDLCAKVTGTSEMGDVGKTVVVLGASAVPIVQLHKRQKAEKETAEPEILTSLRCELCGDGSHTKDACPHKRSEPAREKNGSADFVKNLPGGFAKLQ